MMDTLARAYANAWLESNTAFQAFAQLLNGIQNAHDFWKLCDEMGKISLSPDIARKLDPNEHDGDLLPPSWKKLVMMDPHGDLALPCVFGWVTAAVCQLHILTQHIAGKLPEAVVK